MSNLLGNKKFEIASEGVTITVTEHTVQDQQVYRLVFGDTRVPLVFTRAATWQGNLWTSVPQGRQQEAEQFGRLIEDHIKQK